MARREDVRLDGYPFEGKFENAEQVESYLSGDQIECLVCGMGFKLLSGHAQAYHDLTNAQYRERFGIPNRYALCTRELSQAKSVRASAERAAYARSYGPNGKPHFNDFSWHIEALTRTRGVQKIRPPEGVASWGTFKKRRRMDPVLRELSKSAIQSRKEVIKAMWKRFSLS
jgi:hypothetical protein